VNIYGQPPEPNMAPDEPTQEGLSDNTKAEMVAGQKVLGQRRQRDDDEHAAGRRATAHRQRGQQPPPEEDDEYQPT
jgi:hypothetical protein